MTDQVASQVVRENSLKQSLSSVVWSTGGKPLAVTPTSASNMGHEHGVSHESMIAMQKALNLSDHQTLGAARIFREGMGKQGAVHPHLKETLSSFEQLVGLRPMAYSVLPTLEAAWQVISA